MRRIPTEQRRAGLDAYVDLLAADPANELTLLELATVARRQSADGPTRTQWQACYATAAALPDHAPQHPGAAPC